MIGNQLKPKVVLLSLLLFLLWSTQANAEIPSAGVLDTVQERYASVVRFWASSISAKATFLFWSLVLISMVWTFGTMALRKADIAEFFSEFIRFTVFVGLFWWFLENGPRIAIAIIDSMRIVGADAANAAAGGAGLPLPSGAIPSPSGVMDIAFTMFVTVLRKTSVWSPIASLGGILISLIVLIVMALIAVNMLVMLISGWMLAYAGIFFLGFGGSRWTSDLAITYFRTVLNMAAQLMAMILIIGVGTNLIIDLYGNMSADYKLKEMAVVMVASIVLLGLVNKVPGLIGGLASGGGTGALGNGYGAGSVVAAATMATAAAATAGAALATIAANVGGGGQALMAAFTKASRDAASGEGSAARDFLGSSAGIASGAASQMSSASPLAAAMGGSGAGTSGMPPATNDIQERTATASNGMQSAEGRAAAYDGGVQSDESPGATTGTQPPHGPDSAKAKTGSSARHNRPDPLSQEALTASVKKAGRVAVGTIGNVIAGGFEITKEAAQNRASKASARMSSTVGSRIAGAIQASQAAPSASAQRTATENSLSPANTAVDADAEVAAFRDKKNDTGGEDT